jgi:prephenate dehydrogenase
VTLGIVGTGLIGGSIGLRARKNGMHVLGFDADPQAASRALAAGATDETVGREALYARADTVAIAAHLQATLDELERLRLGDPVRARLIVDVASVKLPVVAIGAGVRNFVATHPIAGSERSGAEHAHANLFEGRTWSYVPSGDLALDARASDFIQSLGAVPLAVGAAEHDAIVAFTSHLPQLVASVYTHRAEARRDRLPGALCGSLARELLRVGSSGFAMWHDILQANAAKVEPELRSLASALLEAADALRAGDVATLRLHFGRRVML